MEREMAGRDDRFGGLEALSGLSGGQWRKLTWKERRIFKKNGNTADDWNNLHVRDGFRVEAVHGCSFIGINRIGAHTEEALSYENLKLPVGISNSVIISSVIGDNSAVHHVRYLVDYVVGDHVLLFNIDEMTGRAESSGPGGSGADGARTADSDVATGSGAGGAPGGAPAAAGDTNVRVPLIAVGNENGGRSVPLFAGMTAADAFICSRNRDRTGFQESAAKMAEAAQRLWIRHAVPPEADPEQDTASASGRRATRRAVSGPEAGLGLSAGGRARIGAGTVIKSCRSIQNIDVTEHARITGANLLKNLTIDGAAGTPTHIGEGVELIDGHIGAGCTVCYGVKAIRFCLATNVTLNNGARCIDTVLGDNITISCCEVVSALVFPFHEQHHNNSFLIAATIQGQCDIAAGATIGSNHNSRAAECEIFARRGFWPGLCVNLKLPSRFASYCLVAKGSYPAELDIRLPFTLVSNNVKEDTLQLYPGYWFMHNMYGLGRNSWKLKNRDARLYTWQTYEYDYLAPDTVEELFDGLELLDQWCAQGNDYPSGNPSDGVSQDASHTRTLIQPEGVEASSRGVVILHIAEAQNAYRDMICYYGIRTLLYYMHGHGYASIEALRDDLGSVSRGSWVNLGGQLIREGDYQALLTGVENGSITSWDEVHEMYRRFTGSYPREKAKHALASLLKIYRIEPDSDITLRWNEWIDFGVTHQRRILERTIESRSKDYQRWFRNMMYDSDAEMIAVLGDPDENAFIRYLKEETAELESIAGKLRR